MRKFLKILISVIFIIIVLFLTKNLYKSNNYEKDLKFFFNICEENYPYYDLVKEDINHNNYMSKAKKCKNDNDFLELLIDITDRFNDLGHMRFFNAWNYYYLYNSYNQAIEKGLINNDDPNYIILSNVKKYYDKRDKDDKTYSRVKKDYNEASSNLKQNVFFRDMDGIPIITIKSFAEEYRKNDIKSIENYLSKFNKDTVIFDIRDNGGGSDYYWYDLVSLTKFKNYEYNEKSYGVGKKSHEYVNKVAKKAQIITLDDNHFVIMNHNTIKSTNKYNFKKVYVIINNKNYSASEGFARFAKENEYATLVGQPTKGSGGGVSLNPMIIELPNTHFIFQMDAIKSKQFNTEPDIYTYANQKNIVF